MTTRVAQSGRFDLGAVFIATGRILKARAGTLVLCALLGYLVLPNVLRVPAGAVSLLVPGGSRYLAVSIASWLANALGVSFVSALITAVALDAGQDRSESTARIMRRTTGAWLTILPIALVSSATGLSLPLLVSAQVPYATIGLVNALLGLILLAGVLFWGLALPVAVAEGGHTGRAIARSTRLLGGTRWLLAVFQWAQLAAVTFAPMLITPSLRSTPQDPASSGGLILYGVASTLPATILQPLWRVFVAAWYLQLRRLREGVAPGDVARIFD